MPSTVIFDVDGTLVDSVGLHAKAWEDAFHDFGYPVSFEEARSQIGKGGDQLLPVFLSEDEIEDIGDKLEEHRSKILKERYLPKIEGFPKVRELMQLLIERGHPIALASSAKEEELQTYKKLADIADLIRTETSSDDAQRSKPHPDIFEAALKRLNYPNPQETFVVGDTPYDAEAASKADLHAIGLLCGGWSADELKKAGCIAVYNDPADLLANYRISPLAVA